MQPEFTVELQQGLENLPQCMEVRQKVFVEEQGFRDEFDEIDGIALHLLLCHKGIPVGTARAFPEEGTTAYHLGRICIVQAYRGKGLGRVIMEQLEEHLQKQGVTALLLSSQVRAKGFYEAMGYVCYGEEYLDEHCPHIGMKKTW